MPHAMRARESQDFFNSTEFIRVPQASELGKKRGEAGGMPGQDPARRPGTDWGGKKMV